MGSALAFPEGKNQNEVRVVGTHLDREIINLCIENSRPPKFEKDFPLLLHNDEILSEKREVNIPWEKFT